MLGPRGVAAGGYRGYWVRGGAVCSRSGCRRDQGRVHGGDCLEPTKEKHKPCRTASRRGEAAFPESQPGPCPAGGAPRGTAPLSAQFSRSGVSGSLRPHEPQHSRPPCPSPPPGVHPNSRPPSSSGWDSATGVWRGCRRQLSGQIGSPCVGSFYDRGGSSRLQHWAVQRRRGIPPQPPACRLKLGRSPEAASRRLGAAECV